MTKFKISRRLSLDFVGEGWEDCYIEYQPIVYRERNRFEKLASFDDQNPKDLQKATDEALKLLKEKFVAGKALTEDGLVDLSADELEDLPVEVLVRSVNLLSGVQDPKA